MLSRFFKRKPKLTDADPARRLAAVQNLDAAGHQPALATLARDDGDASVRVAAMERLTPPYLGTLLEAAEARQDRSAALDIAGRLAALGDDHAFANHPLIAVARCAQAPSAAALATIGDAELAALAITQVGDAEARAKLADAVWNEDRLTALEAQTRNRDKTTHRLAKERLAALKRLQQARTELLARAESLADAARRLLPTDTQLAARRDALSQEWQSVWGDLDANAASLARFDQAPAAETALRQRFSLPEDAAAEPPPAATAPAHGQSFEQLLAELEALEKALLSELDALQDAGSFAQRLAAIEGQWRQAADAAAPGAATGASYRALRERLRDILDALQRTQERRGPALAILALDTTWTAPKEQEDFAVLWQSQGAVRRAAREAAAIVEAVAWPADATAPAWLDELAAKEAALRGVDERCHETFLALQQDIAESIAKMEAHVEAGEVTAASRLRDEANQRIRRLPKSAQAGPSARLASRSGPLKELHAWQAFAERGRREALCDEMEALADNPLPPGAQAERIKALRKRVQAVGRIRSGTDRMLMERFDAAAERAFAPCRKHFEALAETRRFNLAQRETICSELEAFLDQNDWQNADYKGVAEILRAAREEWRTYHPVDRSPGKQVEARFKAVTDQLHKRLKTDWERNLAAKEAIVETARAAVAADRPVPELVELMKRLQREWKEVGPTPRQKDQKLWKAFRDICDHVFGARDTDRVERRSKASSAVAEANALVDDVLSAASEDATEVPDRAMLRDFEARAQALEGLPREVERRLQRALSDFEREVALAASRRRVQEEAAHIERMDALDAALAALEREGGATAAWQAEAGDLKAAFAPRLAGAGTHAADAEALKRLAVEAEIAAELDSPAEDHALRLAVRMERLQGGLGNHDRERADSGELLERWCASAAEQRGAEAARERFFAALRRIVQR